MVLLPNNLHGQSSVIASKRAGSSIHWGREPTCRGARPLPARLNGYALQYQWCAQFCLTNDFAFTCTSSLQSRIKQMNLLVNVGNVQLPNHSFHIQTRLLIAPIKELKSLQSTSSNT
jgi:hypothetical protein